MPDSDLSIIIQTLLQATDESVKAQLADIQRTVSKHEPIQVSFDINKKSVNDVQRESKKIKDALENISHINKGFADSFGVKDKKTLKELADMTKDWLKYTDEISRSNISGAIFDKLYEAMKNTKSEISDLDSTYREFVNHVNKSKINFSSVSNELRSPKEYGNPFVGISSKSGADLDVWYQEAQNMFSHILPEDAWNLDDRFVALRDALIKGREMLKRTMTEEEIEWNFGGKEGIQDSLNELLDSFTNAGIKISNETEKIKNIIESSEISNPHKTTETWFGEIEGDPAKKITNYIDELGNAVRTIETLDEETGRYSRTLTDVNTNFKAFSELKQSALNTATNINTGLYDDNSKARAQEIIEEINSITSASSVAEGQIKEFISELKQIQNVQRYGTTTFDLTGSGIDITSSKEALQDYIKTLEQFQNMKTETITFDDKDTITRFNALGEQIRQESMLVQQSDGEWKKFKITLMQNSSELRILDDGIKKVTGTLSNDSAILEAEKEIKNLLLNISQLGKMWSEISTKKIKLEGLDPNVNKGEYAALTIQIKDLQKAYGDLYAQTKASEQSGDTTVRQKLVELDERRVQTIRNIAVVQKAQSDSAIQQSNKEAESKQKVAEANKKMSDTAQMQKTKEDFRELISLLKEMNGIQGQLQKISIEANPNTFKELTDQYELLQSKFSELFKTGVTQNPFAQQILHIQDFTDEYEKGQRQISLASAEIADKIIKDRQKEEESTQRATQKEIESLSGFKKVYEEKIRLIQESNATLLSDNPELNNQFNGFVDNLNSLDNIQGINNLKHEFTVLTDDIKLANQSFNLDMSIERAKQKMGEFLSKFSAVKSNPALMQQFQELGDKLNEINNKTDMKKWQVEWSQWGTEVEKSGLKAKSFGDILSSSIQKFSMWLGIGSIIMQVTRQLRTAVTTITEMDNSLTELSKVIEITRNDFQQMGIEAFEFASKYGRSAKDVLDAQVTIARAGFENYKQMAELSLLVQAAGDMNENLASAYIIASDKAFKYGGNVEKLTALLDAQNQVSNRHAIDMEFLAEATKNAGNSMILAGETEQTMTAALTTMGVATQKSGAEIGRAARTIEMRIQQVKQAFKGLETEVDGEIINAKELSNAAKALDEIGIQVIKVENGVEKFATMTEIAVQLADALDRGTLSAVEMNKIVDALAGKNRAETFLALVNNIDEYYRAMDNYNNATGSAMEEAMKQAESWEGRVNALKNTWASFIAQITDISGFGTQVVGGLDSVLKPLTSLIAFILNNPVGQITIYIMAINALGSALQKFAGTKFAIGTIDFFKGIGDFPKKMSEIGSVFDTVGIKAKSLTSTTKDLYKGLTSFSSEALAQIRQSIQSVQGFGFDENTNLFHVDTKELTAAGRVLENLGTSMIGLTTAQKTALLSTQALSTEQKMLVLTSSGLTVEQAKVALATTTTTAAQQGATVATFSLRNAWEALKISIASNPIGLIITGITIAVTAAISVFQKFKREQEEATQKQKELIQAANQASRELEQQSKSLENTKAKIIELRKALDAENLSVSESQQKKEELLSIQKDLIEQYGLMVSGVNFMTDSVDKLSRSIEELQKKNLKNWYNENIEAINHSVDTFENTDIDLEKYFVKYTASTQNFKDFIDRIGAITKDFKVVVQGTLEERYDQLEKLMDYINSPTLSYNVSGITTEQISEQMKAIRDELEANKDNYAKYIEYKITNDTKYANAYKSILEAQKTLDEAYISGNKTNIQKATKELQAVVENGLDISKYASKGIKNFFQEFADAYKKLIDEATVKDLISDNKALADSLKGLSEDTYLNEWTDNQKDNFNEIRKYISGTSLTVQDLIRILVELGYLTPSEKLIGDFQTLSGIVSGFSNELSLLDIVQRDFGKNLNLGEKDLENYEKSLSKIKDTYPLLYEALLRYDKQKTNFNKRLVESTLSYYQEVEAAKQAKNSYEDNVSTLEKLYSIQKDNNDEKKLSYFQMLDLITQYPQLASSIKLTENGYILEGNALERLIELKREDLRLSLESQRTKAEDIFKVAAPAVSDKTIENITNKIQSGEITSGSEYIESLKKQSGEAVHILNGLEEYIDTIIAIEKALEFSTGEIQFPIIDTSKPSTAALDKLLDTAKHYPEQLKDLELALKSSDDVIAKIQSDISKAEAMGDDEAVKDLTQNLINARKERVEIYGGILSDTRKFQADIKAAFSQFSNIELTDTGIARYRQSIENQITNLDNAISKTENNSVKRGYEIQRQNLQKTLSDFNEYVTAIQYASNQEKQILSEIQNINDTNYKDVIKEADKVSQTRFDDLKDSWEKRSISEQEFLTELENLIKDSDISQTQRKNITDYYQNFLDETYGRIKKEIEKRENLLLPDDFEGQAKTALEKVSAATEAIAAAIEEGYGEGSALIDSLQSDLADAWSKYSTSMISSLELEYDKTNDITALNEGLLDLYDNENLSLKNKAEILEAINSIEERAYERAKNRIEHEIFLYKKNTANGIGEYDEQKVIDYYKFLQDEAHKAAEAIRKDLGDKGYTPEEIENDSRIKEYQKNWWGYYDSINDEKANKYNKWLNEQKNAISLLEINEADKIDIISSWHLVIEGIKSELENFDGNSDEFSKEMAKTLTTDIRDAEDIIKATREQIYSDWLSDRKNIVTGMERNDSDKRDIINFWRETLYGIEAEIESFNGKTDEYSKQRVRELTNDLYEVKNTTAKVLDDIVKEATSSLNEVKSLYSDLLSAAQEFADSGFITTDQFEAIISHGVQYLSLLEDENGQLVISEDSIKKVIAARTEQLAVETAMNYVYNIRQALQNGETETLNQLLYATDMNTQSTWDLVYAYAALNKSLGMTDEQYEMQMKNLKNLRSLQDSAISGIGQMTGELKKAREEAEKAQLETLREQERSLNDLLRYVMDMIRWETKLRIDGIKDQIKAFEELINLRKQELQEMQKKRDFEKEMEQQTKSLAKLQAELAKLERDNSGDPAIKAKKQALAEQIAEMQGNIDEKINDKYVEEMEAAYDEDAKIFRETKEKEIAVLEDTISSTEKLYQLAISRISAQWDTLYVDLINWNYTAGSTIQSELVSAWDNASIAVQRYGSYLDALLQTQQQISALSSSMSSSSYSSNSQTGQDSSGYPTTVSNTGNYDTTPSATAMAQAQEQLKQENARNIVSKMQSNSSAWWNANDTEKKRLVDENERLATELQSLIGRAVVKNNASGKWYIDNLSGQELYKVQKFREGGVVDYTGIAEVHGSKSSPEMMLNNNDVAKVYDLIHASDNLTDGLKKDLKEVKSEFLNIGAIFENLDFANLLTQTMAQGGLNTYSSYKPTEDLSNALVPKNYATENDYSNVAYGDTNIDLHVHGVTGDEVVQKINQAIPNIINQVKGSQVQDFRNRGIMNKGSTGQRISPY